MDGRTNAILRTLRLRGAWLLILPFFWLARPSVTSLVAGLVVSGAGVFCRGWAAGHLHKDEVLATGGPFAHTRNPLYLGSFLIGIGVTLAGALPLFLVGFAVFFLALYSAQSRVEADFLAERFGDRYAEYASAVPLLLPRPTPYRASAASSFSWERYRANREWEAALGVAAGFAGLFAKLVWFG